MKSTVKSNTYPTSRTAPTRAKVTRGWPPARRKAQAARIRATKPWLKATGPRTEAGKARSSRNAITHGGRTFEMNEIRRFLRWQAQFLKKVWEQINDTPSLRATNRSAAIQSPSKILDCFVDKTPRNDNTS